jgi:hypothetical protein
MNPSWQKPEFTELVMNAEIGSYQEDSGSRGNPPVVDPDEARDEGEDA